MNSPDGSLLVTIGEVRISASVLGLVVVNGCSFQYDSIHILFRVIIVNIVKEFEALNVVGFGEEAIPPNLIFFLRYINTLVCKALVDTLKNDLV